MFSKNLDHVPDNLSKKILFPLLNDLGIIQSDLEQLDSVLNTHGFYTIQSITSVIIIGSNTLSVAMVTNTGTGTFQFNKLDRLKSIEVTYMPTNVVGGGIKRIMRIDLSGRDTVTPVAPEESEAETNEGSS